MMMLRDGSAHLILREPLAWITTPVDKPLSHERAVEILSGLARDQDAEPAARYRCETPIIYVCSGAAGIYAPHEVLVYFMEVKPL